MRRISFVALAFLVVATAAVNSLASEAAPAVNAATIASGVALDRESVKQAVAATQAVGLTTSQAAKQLAVRPAPAAAKDLTPAAKGVAQAPAACPPAIDQATLKQVLLPALESALKEIRAEMSGAQKPVAQPTAPAPAANTAPAPKVNTAPALPVKAAPAPAANPAPAVKAAPAPKPEANVKVWPAIPACGQADTQPVAVTPPGVAPIQNTVEKPASASTRNVDADCANCNRERVAPTPTPAKPASQVHTPAAKPAGAAAPTAANITENSGLPGSAQHSGAFPAAAAGSGAQPNAPR